MEKNHAPTTSKIHLITRDQIHAALNQLQPIQKVIIHLHFWEDCNLQEIAEELGQAREAICQLLRSTIQELRLLLESAQRSTSPANAA